MNQIILELLTVHMIFENNACLMRAAMYDVESDAQANVKTGRTGAGKKFIESSKNSNCKGCR
jgi:hypothetical protein